MLIGASSSSNLETSIARTFFRFLIRAGDSCRVQAVSRTVVALSELGFCSN